MLILRDYQKECITLIKSKETRKYLIVLATALGKTIIFTELINGSNKRFLILSHREELVNQPVKYITDLVGIEQGKISAIGNERIVSACVPTLIKRLEKYPKDYFDVIITDECFPEGTLISTLKGEIPIEKIQCDDIIASYNHNLNCIEYKKVTHLFKNDLKDLIKINLKNGKELICTCNHPIYTKDGYKLAYKLDKNDELLCMQQRSKRKIKKKTQASLLFARMFSAKIERNNVKNKQNICIPNIAKNGRKQSYEKSRNSKESIKSIKRNRALPKNFRREWSKITSTTTKFIGSIKYIKQRICGISCYNKSIYKSSDKKWLSYCLQDRYSDIRLYDSNRSRWKFPLCINKTSTRQKKRNSINWIRLESIEIQKQRNIGESRELCKTDYVYNLEVEGNNNYFANNILVHNCHHAVCASYQKIYDHFNFKLHLGFTATPNRADDVRLNMVFDEILYQKDIRYGIENKYLSNIYCLRFYMDYDLSKCKSKNGDYQIHDLEKAVNTIENATAIAKIYNENAVGSTLIFGVSVAHCEAISTHIKDSIIITAKTKNRAEIIAKFTSGEIKCLINCMIFTEGTDIPRVETLIMARPTKNSSLYCLDLETEILTSTGWKKYNTMDVINDRAATFNINNNTIKYELILNYICRDLGKNENFASINTVSANIRVSNRHNLIYHTKGTLNWRMSEADQLTKLKDGFYIPVSGQYDYKGIPLTDEEIKFIAWVKTDGNINKINNAISISQSCKHLDYINEIENCIKKSGMKYNKIFNSGKTNFSEYREQYIFTISKGQPRSTDRHLKGWNYLEKYLLTEELWEMNNYQFDIFINTCNKADGNKHKPENWNKQSFDITKGNKEFIEKLQIACITRGYRASINTYINQNKHEQYTIHVKKINFCKIGAKYDTRPTFENEIYRPEKCWCIETTTGTIITRRHGKVTFMGNCQMVGRGLRLFEGKEKLLLIDCCGTSNLNLCTAPTLIGVDMLETKKRKPGRDDEIEGDLFELPAKIEKSQDKPDFWKINYKIVDLWAKSQGYNTHNINFIKSSSGNLILSLSDKKIKINKPDELGKTLYHGEKVPMQEVIDKCFTWLSNEKQEERPLWDLSICKKWGQKPATPKQKNIIKQFLPNYNVNNLTSLEASQIIARLLRKEEAKK